MTIFQRDVVRRGTVFALRVLVALVFLWHGVPKALDASMASEKFVGYGLPGVLGPVIGWVEVIAGLLLLVGVMHRIASLTLAVVIVGAIVTVQLPGGITAGLERDLLILAATLLLAAHQPGLFALGSAEGEAARDTGADGSSSPT